MKKKTQKKAISNGVFYVVISLVAVVAIGFGVAAYSGGEPNTVIESQVVQGDYISEAASVDGEPTFGNTIGTDIYQPVTFWDKTSIRQPDAVIEIPLTFTVGTSTATGVALPVTQVKVGSAKNTINRMLCNMASVDVRTPGLFGFDLQLGIATSNTSSATLIAATPVVTSTANILNKEDDEGSTTDEVYELALNSYVTATMTIDAANATSSASFTTAGGNTTKGTAYVNCWNQ